MKAPKWVGDDPLMFSFYRGIGATFALFCDRPFVVSFLNLSELG